MPVLSLAPVTAALSAALNVAAFTALAPGGASDDIAQGTAFPFLWFEVREAQQQGGLGTWPGRLSRPELELRLHVFTRSDETTGLAQNHAVMAKAIELLFAAPLTVTGYTAARFFPNSLRTTPLANVEMLGVLVRELVTDVQFWVTENA